MGARVYKMKRGMKVGKLRVDKPSETGPYLISKWSSPPRRGGGYWCVVATRSNKKEAVKFAKKYRK